jgi:hypothetical protein
MLEPFVNSERIIKIIDRNPLGDEPLKWQTADRKAKMRKLLSTLEDSKDIVSYGSKTYGEESWKRINIEAAKLTLICALGKNPGSYEKEIAKIDKEQALGKDGIYEVNTTLANLKQKLIWLLSTDLLGLRVSMLEGTEYRTTTRRGASGKYRFNPAKWPELESLIMTLTEDEFGRFAKFWNKESFCTFEEFLHFFTFGRECYDLVIQNEIKYLFFADRSARILGVFLHHLFNTNHLADVSCQFVLAKRNYPEAQFAHKRQKQLVAKQRVLIIDEFFGGGGTVESITNLITGSGAEKVMYRYFSSNKQIFETLPSWYNEDNISGLEKHTDLSSKKKKIWVSVIKYTTTRIAMADARRYVKELAYWVAKAIKLKEGMTN